MRTHQIIFLALIAAAFVVALIKSPRKMIGGVAGGLLGVWRGGDPTAAGAFPFFCFITLPLGIAVGVIVANCIPRRG